MRFLGRIGSKSLFQAVLAFLFLSVFSVSPLRALEFGENKVRYHTDHQWKIFETEHFEIYYYQGCETLAKAATRYAEDAFVTTSELFGFVPKNKIPLFIYGTSSEFQETNITPQILSEGVGGFTEVFKNRIVVPMGGSYYEFEKVIHHELTHAFQYDLIYGEGWRSVNLFKAVFVPNWMMEGMAEWNAKHWEAQGEMVLRDAILNDDVIPLEHLDSFDHFEQVYTAYKESTSILEYITQVYGRDKVGLMMKKMAANQPPDGVIKNLLGLSMNELYDNWHFFMKSQAWARINGMPAPERYGTLVDAAASKSAVSPDGTKVAYIRGDELVLLDPVKNKKETLLKKNFQTQGSGLAWSGDGNFLAFAAGREGEYKLYTFELKGRKLREINIPKMPVIFSPAWSKDQRSLVFSGFDYATVDLYRVSLADGKLDRLTDDLTTKSWAAYSNDGTSLYYLCEDSGETQIRRLDFNENGSPQNLPLVIGTDLGSISSFRVGKNALFFTSNRDKRIFNLFRMDFAGDHLAQLTRSFADLISVAPSPDESTFYVSLYQKSRESLYSFNIEKMETILQPPSDLSYLQNTFSAASKVIPVEAVKMESKDGDGFPGAEKNDSETPKDKKPPTAPPAPVARLEVTESSNIVQIQWPVPAESEAASIDGYRVYRSTEPEGTFIPVGSTLKAGQVKYVDYTVESGKKYFYYVTAVNKLGESGQSQVVEADPGTKIISKDYHFRISPDILLLLAGFDSSAGFVGGGIVQMSDYLGDHRLSLLGDTVPGVETGFQANYEFSQWRTTVDFNVFYYQNFLNIYDLQTGNIVNQYRNNENGVDLNFSYPLSPDTRVEYGLGTQRFQGNPLYLRFSEGISNYFLNSDQWNIANYYRLSFVQDKRRGTQFWPSSGYSVNLTVLHAPPVFDYNVSFANMLLETQVFADIGFLNHLVWANRFIAMTSQGPNPQTFFIGDDAPFQAYFTTIRGYGANTAFGSNLGLWNTELRYPIATHMNFIPQPLSFIMIKDIELAGFMDTGIVSNQLSDIPTSPVLSSIGTGIRFYTFLYQRALVMLRFDVAWRLDQPAAPTFHFNLAPMF